MARPLNKKYFGNRNIGTNGYEGIDTVINMTGNNPGNAGEVTNFYPNGDDGIGGEGVAGIQTFTERGAYLERIPTVTFSEASLPGGITATGTVSLVRAVAASVNNRGTGYQIGDIVQIVGGTGTAATFRVTKLRVIDIQLVEGASSQNFDGGENLVWDSLVDDNWTTPTVISNISSSGSPNYDITGWASWTGGVWDGYAGGSEALAPTTLTLTGGGNGYNTRGTGDTLGGSGDNNGSGGTVAFTYGIESVEVVSGGNYTAVLGEASSLINQTVGAVGANGTLDVFYGVYGVTMIQKGSGYINAADAVPTFSETIDGAETQATASAYLTYDFPEDGTGYKQGNANNQENAIIVYAYQEGQRRIADIVEQTGSKRYVCTTSRSGPGTLKEAQPVYGYLVAHDAAKAYEIDMGATDAEGHRYYVTKLEGHKAVLAQRSTIVTYTGTGYIDNNTVGGNGPGATFHLVSITGTPELNLETDLAGTILTWTADGGGSATITTWFGSYDGNNTYFIPGANAYLGSSGSPVNFTLQVPVNGSGWLFENGSRVEWRLSNDINPDQVTIDNA